ncbi:hypothetical protein GYMLUDRAFT_842497 [Collybiopsis luxurians FD-317 M1]|uniref:Uncharacterized protein n=1 Tax=Collybiopsis luxurians FD-317 M1 TaxID=944289 RepID=A0A0D0CBC8_9AGAR|nr:hypothetical protein GYMLUDRAFT_842497 [Collybiopsis luxurians FD-317 M1]
MNVYVPTLTPTQKIKTSYDRDAAGGTKKSGSPSEQKKRKTRLVRVRVCTPMNNHGFWILAFAILLY